MFCTKLFMARGQCTKLTKPCRADTALPLARGWGNETPAVFGSIRARHGHRGNYPEDTSQLSTLVPGGGFPGGCFFFFGLFFFFPAIAFSVGLTP